MWVTKTYWANGIQRWVTFFSCTRYKYCQNIIIFHHMTTLVEIVFLTLKHDQGVWAASTSKFSGNWELGWCSAHVSSYCGMPQSWKAVWHGSHQLSLLSKGVSLVHGFDGLSWGCWLGWDRRRDSRALGSAVRLGSSGLPPSKHLRSLGVSKIAWDVDSAVSSIPEHLGFVQDLFPNIVIEYFCSEDVGMALDRTYVRDSHWSAHDFLG